MKHFLELLCIIFNLSIISCNENHDLSFLSRPAEQAIDTIKAVDIFRRLDSCYVKDGFQALTFEAKNINDDYLNSKIDSTSYIHLIREINEKYEKLEVIELEKFFKDWKETIKPIPGNRPGKEILKDIYEIHKLFFDPFDSNKIIGKYCYMYSDDRYILVPSKLYIKHNTDKRDSNDEIIYDEYILEDFRPDVQFENTDILYLTPEYQYAIELFLSDDHIPLGQESIMQPAKAAGESHIKMMYLSKFITIIHGHWGGYWHLETFPYLYSIVFNNSFSEATGGFRVVYQGGTAEFKKSAGKWEMLSCCMTWIE